MTARDGRDLMTTSPDDDDDDLIRPANSGPASQGRRNSRLAGTQQQRPAQLPLTMTLTMTRPGGWPKSELTRQTEARRQ